MRALMRATIIRENPGSGEMWANDRKQRSHSESHSGPILHISGPQMTYIFYEIEWFFTDFI